MAEGPLVLRLSFAFNDLEELNPRVIEKHAATLRELDLTSNKFSDLISLRDFTKLETLILDCNAITSQTKIPKLPNLTTLWVNKNKIANLATFASKVSDNLPNLKYLSMLGNPACPNFLNGGSPVQYQDYRHFVISKVASLLHLDSTPITEQEREASWKKYKPENLKLKTTKSASALATSSSQSDVPKTIEKSETTDTTIKKKKKKKKTGDNTNTPEVTKKKKKGKKANDESPLPEAKNKEDDTIDKANLPEKSEVPAEKMTKTKKAGLEGLMSALPDLSQLDLVKKQEKIAAKSVGKKKTNVDYDDEWSSDDEFDSDLLDDEEWDE